MPKHPPKKILIIRFSSIGDIVLTTPVIRCVKNQTNAAVFFLTKEIYRPILQANPYVEKIFSFEHNLSEVIPDLKKENFDYIIDLHRNIRSRLVLMTLQKPNQTFDKLNIPKWVMVNFKINMLPDLHIVDRYMAAVHSLGVKNDNKGLDFFIPKQATLNINQLEKPFISIAIGGAHFTKQIPTEKIITLCNLLEFPVLLIGGKEDQGKGQVIKNAVGEKIRNTCGQLTLNQSALLIKQSEWIITSDTGMMHIAAALGKNIISVWGNTIPEFGMYPYMKNEHQQHHLFQINNLSCRPCSKIGYSSCPQKHFRCMLEQDVKVIAGIANSI